MTHPPRPIAVTCGDMAGIGPEITVAARRALGADVPLVVIGDARAYATLATQAGLSIARVDTAAQAVACPGDTLPVLDKPLDGPVTPGCPDLAHARNTLASIDTAVTLAQAGAVSAICTNPINKKVLVDGAGFNFPGHTEYLAHLGGVDRVIMMLAAPALRVVPATIHIPLAQVPAAISAALLDETLAILHAALICDFAIPQPRIAVAGLNPHAGEGGLMGTEDDTVIAPVIARHKARGWAIDGPMSADTMFHPAARAAFDAALCMYHDQALIPIKTLDFSGGVNVTLGLPFVRTSPDHGTAYGIAGTGSADPGSLIAALRLAMDIGANRAACAAPMDPAL